MKIDWEGLEKITSEEKGGAIEAFYDRLKELTDSEEEVEQRLMEIQNEIEEIKQEQRDSYLSFEERVVDALVAEAEKVIETAETLSEEISNSNEQILNSLQQSIDLTRQIRDNTKTTEEISDKESQLAYLQRDGSGANELLILQLEEELAEMRETYADSVVDQELERLNEQSEKAAEQRERQIEIMESQLSINEKTGRFAEDAAKLIAGSYMIPEQKEALQKLLQETEGFQGMSTFTKEDWMSKLHVEWLKGSTGASQFMVDEAEEQGASGGFMLNGKKYEFNNKTGVWTGDGKTKLDLNYNAGTGEYKFSGGEDISPPKEIAPKPTQPTEKPLKKGARVNILSGYKWWSNSGGGDSGNAYYWSKTGKITAVNSGARYPYHVDGSQTGSGWMSSRGIKAYKTGGLNTTTGPAWLDGTKTKPEYILNAEQTAGFLKMADHLAGLKEGTGFTGDNYFDINIAVDSISNDYDVEQMANKIKNIITEDSMYRNVNSINWIR